MLNLWLIPHVGRMPVGGSLQNPLTARLGSDYGLRLGD